MPPRTQQNLLWSIIEISDDLGVYNVGGRLGAAGGPEAFWKIFSKLNGKTPLFETMATRVRAAVTSDIEQNHISASNSVCEAAQRGEFTIVVGGGHDHGYSHLQGIQRAHPKSTIGCINIDAHLDVRRPHPKITSGSPFYLALESKILEPKNLVEFGIQSQSNAPNLFEYAEQKKIPIYLFSDLRNEDISLKKFNLELKRLEKCCDQIVISLDLDALSQSFCPGVSAPQAEGFSPSTIFQMLESAATSPKVLSLGIFELNPLYDVDHKTARVASTAAWRFLEIKHKI